MSNDKKQQTMETIKLYTVDYRFNGTLIQTLLLVNSVLDITSLIPSGSIIEKVEFVTEDEEVINNTQF